MFEKIGQFFASLPAELYVFIVSILPIVELRASIPIGAALGLPFYVNYGLSVLGNILPVPFILLFIPKILDFLGKFKFFSPMVEWLRKRAYKNSKRVLREDVKTESAAAGEGGTDAEAKIENAAEACEPPQAEAFSSGEALLHTSERQSEKKRDMTVAIFTSLFLFVAVPLPGTGAWMGSLIAALFGLPKRRSFIAISVGVMISGIIMSLASYGVVGFLSFLI